MALVLAGTISVFSCLTAVAVEMPKCAGHGLLEGYRASFADIWIAPLVSMIFVVVIAALPWAESVKNFLRLYDLPVFGLISMQITLGTLVIYSNIFLLLALLGVFTESSAARYNAIVRYCSSATAIGPSKADATISAQHLSLR